MSNGNLSKHPAVARHQRVFEKLGYKTVAQVAGATRVARKQMTAALKEDISGEFGGFEMAAAAAQGKRFALGVALERIPPPAVAFALSFEMAAALPASVNLIADLPTIRNQADRGTCVAHASLAAFEHLRQTQGTFEDMSEQFLYWDCKQHDGAPQGYGTWVEVAMNMLQRDGCCLEATWPYNPSKIAGNEGQDPAPAAATAQAPTYKIANFTQLPPTSVHDIKTELARGRAVAFSVPLFNTSLENDEVISSGDFVLPWPGEAVAGGHAMCMVGYQDDAAEEAIGGGRFILRNSWGPAWGANSPHGAGYGTIPYSYILTFGREAFSIE